MPPKEKKYPCSAKIKNEKSLEIEPCGSIIPAGGRCPRYSEHMMSGKTGFCENGNCEGTNKRSYSGKTRPTCKWWKLCSCECHISYDRMFAMGDMDRQIVDNSGYVPDHGGFWMPTLEERAAMIASSTPASATSPRLEESPAPDIVPATLVKPFVPTPSGRAAPGELEWWVKKQTDIWLVENEDFPCTPKYLAEEISRTEGIAPPSVGAITAVFNRWVKLGFAEIGVKPARFIKYTEDGIKYGLEGCKERAKRKRRNAEAAAGRRIGRG
jgi:hypothetical protein